MSSGTAKVKQRTAGSGSRLKESAQGDLFRNATRGGSQAQSQELTPRLVRDAKIGRGGRRRNVASEQWVWHELERMSESKGGSDKDN